MHMNNSMGSFGDKEMFADVLCSEKMVASNYNMYATECVSPSLKSDMVNILNDQQQIQHEIFSEMKNRGWYNVEQADQNKINEAKQKFAAGKS